ncbi:MAG: hypothetical protein FD157_658 [Rhodocyclaceae bacterium]|nr:MAG: hypothetical protein FD157_658 [Rhodocyclaceae bacterium]TND03152.1 MAG: hypothetical protein FD118_1728 [Rhodocyclaceae bacterium]
MGAAMLTRCPACATHFRITPAQLKARSGSVRCGACQHVFNALDSLIEEPVLVAAPPLPESTQQSLATPISDFDVEAAGFPDAGIDETTVSPAPTPELAEEVPEEILALNPEALEASIGEHAEVAEIEAAEIEVAEIEVAEPEAAEPEVAEPETPEAGSVADADSFPSDWSETFPEPPPPPRRWPWVIGSLVALTAIGLQAVIAFRAELVVLWPQVKPALVALCDTAGCEVGLPTKVGLVGIEASDLHPDSERKSRLTLTATLKNRAPFPQTFPHLELTLTDTEDKAVARKVLAPPDYLPPNTLIPQGMQPGADIPVMVGIDSGELAASGYRLYLFYP